MLLSSNTELVALLKFSWILTSFAYRVLLINRTACIRLLSVDKNGIPAGTFADIVKSVHRRFKAVKRIFIMFFGG